MLLLFLSAHPFCLCMAMIVWFHLWFLDFGYCNVFSYYCL